ARPVRGEVEISNVTFRYGPSLPEVISNLSLRIGAGEVVALVGPSGAGKKTIASLIPRFWDVDEGSVTLDGHDVRELSLNDLRGSIGIVPQEPSLVSGTIRENIAYALIENDTNPPEDAIYQAAAAAHATE